MAGGRRKAYLPPNRVYIRTLTWGEEDEEITVKYTVEPKDESVGIFYTAVVPIKITNRDTKEEWSDERFEAEGEAIAEYLETYGGLDVTDEEA